jgi:hypothetical protein
MMKKISIKILSVLCIFAIVFSMFNVVAFADDGEFILLSISGYNDDGEESINTDNVFYVRNNVLYAPIKLFEDYTMYDYDEENSAFVRAGQEYKKSNSKVVFNYEDATMDVFYTGYQKETYDLDFYRFGDTYFFPLDEMAAYLKSSIVYKSGDTISILSSGVSLSDALYNYEPLSSCLDYDDLRDDIFAGDETLFKAACVFGYFGETVFSFKITNLMGEYGDYKKYLDILESAVTNNEPYEQLLNNDNLLSDLLGVTDELYNEVYKKATTIYKLSSNSVTTMFEDFKSLNSFGDESPFDNFFPEEQLEIDKINSLSEYIDTADLFIDIVDFYHKFYTMNQDNKDAIELFGSINDYDTRALALSEISSLYGNNVVESAATKMRDEISKELLKEYAGEVAKEFMSGANKVKLATSIVNSVFKAMGFDLSDNSGYDVMLASQLKHFVLNTIDGGSIDLNTENDCGKLRLTLILGMLIDIQSYKMGNKFAAKHEAKGIYDDEIDEANKRLALFYLAKDSVKYDSVEGIKKIANQNKKQISKLDFSQFEAIPFEEAKVLITRFNSSVVNQLSHGTWYDLYVFAHPGDVFQSYTFDKNGNVEVYCIDNVGEEQYSTSYTVLNDKSLQFELNTNRIVTVDIIEDSNVVRVLYESKNADEDKSYCAWTNEEYDLNKPSDFAKNILGHWNSEYMSNKFSTCQLVSIYQVDNNSNSISGAIIVNQGQIDLYGYSITDNLVSLGWYDGWLLLEKTDNDNIVNALIFNENDSNFEYETWTRLN